MGITVLLVQHGDKVRSSGDPGLTDVGRLQAQQVAAHVRQHEDVEAIWSSPLARARETAQPIAEAFGLDIHTDARLRERMNWAGHGAIEDFLKEWQRASQDRDHAPTVGDSSNEAARRFLEALADIEQARPPKSAVVVVAHGGVTVDALRTILGDEHLRSENPDLIPNGVPCGAITRLEITDGQVAVVALPDATHLTKATPHRPG